MNQEAHLISPDKAIEHFVSKGYSSERIRLPSFEEFDCGEIDEAAYKRAYDEIFTKNIGNEVKFYAYCRLNKAYMKRSMPDCEFMKWLEDWWYDDDLILISDIGWASVFHHSGYVFYLQPNE